MRIGKAELAGVLFMAAVVFAAGNAFAGEEELIDYTKVSLSDIQKNPTTYKNVGVSIKVKLHKIENTYSPVYTSFLPESYVAFSVWDGKSRLWVKDDMAKDFPFVYVSKLSEYMNVITESPKYAELEICGLVQNDFNNVPWIEALIIKKVTFKRLTEQAIHHLILGAEFMKEQKNDEALRELELVRKIEIPDCEMFFVLKNLADMYYAKRDYENAHTAAHDATHIKADAAMTMIMESCEKLIGHVAPGVTLQPPQTGPSVVERDLKEKVAKLEAKLQTSDTELSAAKKELAAAKKVTPVTDVTKVQKELADAQAKLTKAEAENKSLSDKLAAVPKDSGAAKVATLEKQVAELKGQVTAKDETITALNKKIADLSGTKPPEKAPDKAPKPPRINDTPKAPIAPVPAAVAPGKLTPEQILDEMKAVYDSIRARQLQSEKTAK
jgi:Skp family chaperone for outer membrane proteins